LFLGQLYEGFAIELKAIGAVRTKQAITETDFLSIDG
jgi:hypothetical protein